MRATHRSPAGTEHDTRGILMGTINESIMPDELPVNDRRDDMPRDMRDIRHGQTGTENQANDGIAMVMFHEDADGLREFFSTVMSQYHAFKVLTPRCHDLFHAFCGDGASTGNGILCGDGLLPYAWHFAERYAQSGTFPNLLLVTDVLVTGRSVYDILYGMEDLVYEILRGRDDQSPDGITRHEVHRLMLDATDIMVYATGRTEDMIFTSYGYRIQPTIRPGFHESSYDPHDPFALELSYNINRFLRCCDVMTDPRILSSKVAPDFAESLCRHEWDRLDMEYRMRQSLLLTRRDNESTVRMAYAFGTGLRDERPTRIAGIPRIDRIPRQGLDAICADIARDVAGYDGSGRIARILSSDCPGTVSYKMSFLSLVDSVETLRHVASDTGTDWEGLLEGSDIGRIAPCFGLDLEVGDALRRILRDQEVTGRYSRRLRQEGSCEHGDGRAVTPVDLSGTVRRYEDALCRAGMEMEVMSYRQSHRLLTPNLSPTSQRHGDVPYDDLRIRTGIGGADASDATLAACEALASMHGLCHTRHVLSQQTGEVIRCVSASRLATCLVPRRHLLFFEALKSLRGCQCWMICSSPEHLVQEFIDELAGNPDVVNRFGRAWLDGIRQDIPWYVDVAYDFPDISTKTLSIPGDNLLFRGIELPISDDGNIPLRPDERYRDDLSFLRQRAEAFTIRKQKEMS